MSCVSRGRQTFSSVCECPTTQSRWSSFSRKRSSAGCGLKRFNKKWKRSSWKSDRALKKRGTPSQESNHLTLEPLNESVRDTLVEWCGRGGSSAGCEHPEMVSKDRRDDPSQRLSDVVVIPPSEYLFCRTSVTSIPSSEYVWVGDLEGWKVCEEAVQGRVRQVPESDAMLVSVAITPSRASGSRAGDSSLDKLSSISVEGKRECRGITGDNWVAEENYAGSKRRGRHSPDASCCTEKSFMEAKDSSLSGGLTRERENRQSTSPKTPNAPRRRRQGVSTSLYRALLSQQVNTVKESLGLGADPNEKFFFPWHSHDPFHGFVPPLFVAAFLGNVEIIDLLVKEGAILNSVNSEGQNAVHFLLCHKRGAAYENTKNTVEHKEESRGREAVLNGLGYFLNPRPKCKENSTMSPQKKSAKVTKDSFPTLKLPPWSSWRELPERDILDCALVLLERGICVDAKDLHGYTALDYARNVFHLKENHPLMCYLLRHSQGGIGFS